MLRKGFQSLSQDWPNSGTRQLDSSIKCAEYFYIEIDYYQSPNGTDIRLY